MRSRCTSPNRATPGVSLHPAEMLFLGTVGGARALDMEDRIGNLDAGREADFLVVDPAGWPPLLAAIDKGTRSAIRWPATRPCFARS